jgi:hypothetical protein
MEITPGKPRGGGLIYQDKYMSELQSEMLKFERVKTPKGRNSAHFVFFFLFIHEIGHTRRTQ